MSSDYCIINPPAVPVREIVAFAARDKAIARAEAGRLRTLLKEA